MNAEMDHPTQDRRLQEAKDLVGRIEENIVFQRPDDLRSWMKEATT